MGYESIVLNRVGTTIEHEMRKSKSSEFVWLDMPHIHHKEKDFDIFAHILVNSDYMAPREFQYQPDDAGTSCDIFKLENNPDPCVKIYYEKVVKPERDSHVHNNVMGLFGGDFHWYDPVYSFKYLKKLVQVINERSKEVTGVQINAKMATVNDYFEAVKKTNARFPIYNSDFSPYVQKSGDGFDHWTGYYSNYPQLKQNVKELFRNLRQI